MNLPNYKDAKKRTKDVVKREYFSFDKDIIDIGQNKTYNIMTYGCQMNVHDSENIKALMDEMSFTEIDNYQDADIVILNTCSIRENSHNKVFGMLGRLKYIKSKRKDFIIILCGCMAQEEGVIELLTTKYKYVDIVFGTHNIHRLPNLIDLFYRIRKQLIEVFSTEGNIIEGIPTKRDSKYKAFVNIIYGCDKFCTYCIVPYTRGKQRSRTKEEIVKEVNNLVKEGYKEVTLLGQNVNAYGKDLDLNYGMETLLEEVSKTGIDRIRFMTSHPWDFTDEMINVIKNNKNIMPSIHLPVQSGSNHILKLMGRRYTKEDYLTLFNKLKEIPNVTISTDIIVGFPGESEKDFNETLELVKYCKFDMAYSFIFSLRKGTAAENLVDNTSLSEKEKRLQILNKELNKYFKESNDKCVGKILKVLVEGESTKKGMLYGYTETNKMINFSGSKSMIGKIVEVEVTSAKTWSLDGKAL